MPNVVLANLLGFDTAGAANADAPAMLVKPSEEDNAGLPEVLLWTWVMSFVEASLDSESDDFARRSTEPNDFPAVSVFDEVPSAPKGDGDKAKLEAPNADLDAWEL